VVSDEGEQHQGISRAAGIVLGSGALVLAGSGLAWAATSGNDLSVKTSGSYVNNAHGGLKDTACKFTFPSGAVGYDGHVSGTFVVTSPNDHLNGKVDAFGWAKLLQVNSAKSVAFDKCLQARDVDVHSSISLQACRDHWYGDDCSSATKP
jgi:hypothetical protein